MRAHLDEAKKLSAQTNVFESEINSKDETIESLQKKISLFKSQLEKTEEAVSKSF